MGTLNMAGTESEMVSRIDHTKQELLPPTVKVVLALVILVAIRFLVVQVPGVNRVIFDPDITIATILYSIITLVMFGAVIDYFMTGGAALARVFESFAAIERIMQLLGIVIVLIWAYQVFWWLPYFRENPAHFDYVFLILILVFIG